MKTIAPLDTLLYDPLSWMHPQRLPLPPAFRGVRTRSVINEMIITSHDWTNECHLPADDGLTPLFIRHWRRLPQVALFIAAQRLRASLARQGRLLLLPPLARQFAVLAIVDSFDDYHAPIAIPVTLIAWGRNELMDYSERLPLAIRQRISLLFSPELDQVTGHEPRTSPSQLLIKLAFQHAESNPITPDAANLGRRDC